MVDYLIIYGRRDINMLEGHMQDDSLHLLVLIEENET